jgi:23S rRNA (guanine1835-N2)-methyltransferase
MKTFESPVGTFDLLPLHHHPKSPLQAWNAADELLLKHASQLPTAPEQVLIANDQHGALATCLNHWQPHCWNDSYSSQLALRKNLSRNKLEFVSHHWIPADQPLPGLYDVVLIKIPKTLSLLEYQLSQLRNHLHPKSQVIAAGMVKHLSGSMIQAFERFIGPTHTSLAQKKARLVLAEFDPALQVSTPAPTQYDIPGTPLKLSSYASVFSQNKLDMGTGFLLKHFPDVSECEHIIDLGCGNGALACYAAWKNPSARISMLDESYLALKSAEGSFHQCKLTNPHQIQIADCLDGYEDKADLILCNPPFHEGNQLDSSTAQRMFKGAKRCLQSAGKLAVVGNRHLDYHLTLRKYFGQVSLIASNRKFVVLIAQ